MTGTLYGVGVGPGDPDLMTLKAVKILESVPVVAYIVAASAKKSLARSIAEDAIGPDKVEIEIPMAMLGDAGPGAEIYDQYAATIAGHLDAGRHVAMLCEGDPLLYGSFMYMLERLNTNYDVVTVPGVSSLGAAAAAAGMALVSRRQTLTIVPATLDDDDLQRRLTDGGGMAIFKVGRHLQKIRRLVENAGRAAGAVFVERASMPGGRVVPLSEVSEGGEYFSMILVPAVGGEHQ